MADKYNVKVDGGEELERGFQRISHRLLDFRPYFKSISSDFYKGNKSVVFKGRPGKYEDLKESTKKRKIRDTKKAYPVLVHFGSLRDSLTKPRDSQAIKSINKTSLSLGTSVPYAKYLQSGTRFMPARPPLIIDVDNRLFRWNRILQEGIEKNVKDNIGK